MTTTDLTSTTAAPTSAGAAAPIVNDTRLSAATGMDAVTLRVGDLEKMSDYYSNALAMEPLEESARGAEVHRVLGRGTTPLVKLVSTPGLPGVDHRQAGLFHTAFLFEGKESLAATVAHAAQNTNSTFAGSSDHLVSQAFYFTDPEGNGIELYVDRARS
jgi:catechol 2,3-dioxygenase